MLDKLFARSRNGTDRQFDDYLTQVLAGTAPSTLPNMTIEAREELQMAGEVGAALSADRAVSPAVRDRLWETVQVRLVATSSSPASSTSIASRARPSLPILRYGMTGVAAALLVLLTFLAPIAQQRWSTQQFLNVAGAAALPPSPGQVLHCTITTTATPTGQTSRWLGDKEIWLDAERQLARIEYRKPGSGLNRQVFDGQTFSAYATRGSNGGREGLYQEAGQTYRRLAESNSCSLNDQLAVVQRELLNIDPRRSIVTSEELLDGMPVIVLSFAMDVRESRAVYGGLMPEANRDTNKLPARYTFTRDGKQLVRLQGWVQTDTPGGAASIEMRLTYSQDPADHYPASFF